MGATVHLHGAHLGVNIVCHFQIHLVFGAAEGTRVEVLDVEHCPNGRVAFLRRYFRTDAQFTHTPPLGGVGVGYKEATRLGCGRGTRGGWGTRSGRGTGGGGGGKADGGGGGGGRGRGGARRRSCQIQTLDL